MKRKNNRNNLFLGLAFGIPISLIIWGFILWAVL